jgi:hypothetical protein
MGSDPRASTRRWRPTIIQTLGAAQGRERGALFRLHAAVPEHLVAEILDGELYTSPRPG